MVTFQVPRSSHIPPASLHSLLVTLSLIITHSLVITLSPYHTLFPRHPYTLSSSHSLPSSHTLSSSHSLLTTPSHSLSSSHSPFITPSHFLSVIILPDLRAPPPSGVPCVWRFLGSVVPAVSPPPFSLPRPPLSDGPGQFRSGPCYLAMWALGGLTERCAWGLGFRVCFLGPIRMRWRFPVGVGSYK